MEKAALFVVYCGAGYKGMQRNPGAATIEGMLEEALIRAGAIGSNGCSRNWLDWKRAARTDKEVSAVGQVVSARLYLDPDLVSRTNSFLPSSIRLLGFKRVPEDFSARKMCDARRYEYVLPVSVFDPDFQRRRPTGSDRCDDANAVSGHLRSDTDARQGHMVDGNAADEHLRSREGFVFDEERFNRILERFVGSDYSYHNFAWHVRSGDPESRRVVIEFRVAKERIWIEGVEFVSVIVLGKSFMAYQIRKMVGLAVAVMRDAAPVSAIDRALRSDVDVVVPTAPELGLLLDECLYDGYNSAASTPEGSKIEMWREFGGEMEEFKTRVIHAHIAETERKQRVFARWLPSLNCKNYSALAI